MSFIVFMGWLFVGLVLVALCSLGITLGLGWLRARREQWGPRLDDTQEWPRIEDTGPTVEAEWQAIVDSFTRDERGAA